MKSKWLLVLAAALVVACQKPAPKATPAPGATSGGGTAMRTDGDKAPDNKSVSAVGESGNTVAKVEDKGDAKPAEPVASPAEQVAGLVSGFDADLKKWSAAMGSATAEERTSLTKERPNAQATYDKIKVLMDSTDDPQVRVEGLVFAGMYLRDAVAIEELVRNHSSNEKVLPMIPMIVRSLPRKADEILELLVAGEENTPAKGVAMFALAQKVQQTDQAKAEELLVKVTSDFADVQIGSTKLADLAGPILFAIQHLGIGKEAPDIEGPDLDGVSFKLSDYRGKVVMLDFWGHW